MSSYQVHGWKKPHRFASMDEARKAASLIFNRHGIVVAITESPLPPTHRIGA